MTNEGGWQGKRREGPLANEQSHNYMVTRRRGTDWTECCAEEGMIVLRWETVSCRVKLLREVRGGDESRRVDCDVPSVAGGQMICTCWKNIWQHKLHWSQHDQEKQDPGVEETEWIKDEFKCLTLKLLHYTFFSSSLFLIRECSLTAFHINDLYRSPESSTFNPLVIASCKNTRF